LWLRSFVFFEPQTHPFGSRAKTTPTLVSGDATSPLAHGGDADDMANAQHNSL